MDIKIKLINPDTEQLIPKAAHHADAGVDLRSAAALLTLAPGERALVPTGIALAIPEGYAAFVHPRSGLAAKHGITVTNAPGTIDAQYRGEIKVILQNTGDENFEISYGDRIAQLVIQKVELPSFTVVDELDETQRGAGGFGSTGI